MFADVAEALLLFSLLALGFWLRGRWDRRRRKRRIGGFIRQPLGVSSLASRVASYTMTGTRTAEGNGSLNTALGLRSVARVTLRERQSASRTGALGFSTDETDGHPGRATTAASEYGMQSDWYKAWRESMREAYNRPAPKAWLDYRKRHPW